MTRRTYSDDEIRAALEASRGNVAATARALGANERSLRRRIKAMRGDPEAPDGFKVTGKSTLIDRRTGETVLEWVKTSRDTERQKQLAEEFVAGLAESVRGLAEPTQPPAMSDADTMVSYVMGDPHLGAYAWAEETLSDDFDSDIASRHIKSAVDYLVAATPASETGMLVNVGDAFHMDSRANATPASGNQLDVDTRYQRVIRIAAFTFRYCIDRLLQKHRRVIVVNVPGNHDPDSSGWLSLCLSMYYEREPRVELDLTPAKFHYHRFGRCLIGITHGDRLKHDDLPSIMATHRARDWGETEHRYWWTGHIHHKRQTEFRGCTVESFNTLAASDAWHAASGYISKREMQALVLHKEHGIIARSICPVGLLKEAA